MFEIPRCEKSTHLPIQTCAEPFGSSETADTSQTGDEKQRCTRRLARRECVAKTMQGLFNESGLERSPNDANANNVGDFELPENQEFKTREMVKAERAMENERAKQQSIPDSFDQEELSIKTSRTEKRWRRFFLIILVIVLLVLLILFLLIQRSNFNNGSSRATAWRNGWSEFLIHGAEVIRRTPIQPIPQQDQPSFRTSVSNVIGPNPCLLFHAPYPDRPPVNWLNLPQTASSPALPRNVVFFHGASIGNESYQDDLKQLSHDFNVTLLSLEFPGFNEYGPTTEDTLMRLFPIEIEEIVTQHLKWRWPDTVIWSNCFGVSVCMNALWEMHVNGRGSGIFSTPATTPAALFMTKTLVSYRNSFRGLLRRAGGSIISQVIPTNLYTLLPSGSGAEKKLLPWQKGVYEVVTCPVVGAGGANDLLCSIKDHQRVLDNFSSSPFKRLVSIPKMGHAGNMYEMAEKNYLLSLVPGMTPVRTRGKVKRRKSTFVGI
jgi:hypothetical protein